MNSEKPALRERANEGLHPFIFDWLQQSGHLQGLPSVLDIGCGTGAWLQRLEKAGIPRLMGLDRDVRQFGMPHLPVQACDMDAYAGEQWGSFALITALEIIEHLSNPGMLLQLASANLAPGGSLVLSTPNVHGLPARLRFLLRGRLSHFDDKSDATHIYPVYYENFERLANRYGFHIVHRGHFPATGYHTYSRGLVWAARLLQPLLGDALPGDNLVYLLKKKESAA